MNVVVTKHVPVLLSEVVSAFNFPGTFLDCTVGGGGHSEAILQGHPENTVWCIDRDQEAQGRARERLASFGERAIFRHSPFSAVSTAVAEFTARGRRFDGVLADLGMSTDQLKGERGFSFMVDAPLDMRMDLSSPLSADQVVNGYAERELLGVFRRGGVTMGVHQLVQQILRQRPIKSTAQLAQLAQAVLGPMERKKRGDGAKDGGGGNTATVVFQAVRMEVNGELDEIRSLLASLPSLVAPGGRVVIISFHSLEDREVTAELRRWGQGSTVPAKYWRGREAESYEISKGVLLTKKAVVPGEDEIRENPAARSARMRVFEFLS